jgi:hypothetical protein
MYDASVGYVLEKTVQRAPRVSNLGKPFERIAIELHNGDMREEGVPYYHHMQRMAERFSHLVHEDAISRSIQMLQATYAIIYLHDVDETFQKRRMTHQWRHQLEDVISSHEMKFYINRGLDLFSRDYGGNVANMIAEIRQDEVPLHIMVNIVKPLDINDNYHTARRWAGEPKTIERIIKAQDYQRYIMGLVKQSRRRPDMSFLNMDRFRDLLTQTLTQLKEVEAFYEQELLQHKSN